MKPMKMKEIVSIVAFQHGTTLNKIKGDSRVASLVQARHRAMKACYEIGYCYNQIAIFFDKDHSTVIYACNKPDPEFDLTYWEEFDNED